MKKIVRHILIVLALIAISLVVLRNYCPTSGLALTTQRRDFHQLKNRAALPRQSDFNARVTLEAFLRPGEDQSRWSQSHAASIEGYVVSVSSGPLESANCFCHRDTHIMLALRPDAPPRQQIVVEVTPCINGNAQALAPGFQLASPGKTNEIVPLTDWSEETLKHELTGRRVRFEGWLFFDSHHAAEAENTAPGRANNWRATAWELHPVTKIEILR
ncbi:MAG: hypothetical protein ABJB61_02890 [bacterium]